MSKKEKEQKSKPKYSILSCVGYVYRLLWENARFLVFVGLGVVPLSILAAAFGLYASPMMINALGRYSDFNYVALTVAGIVLAWAIVNTANGMLQVIVQNSENHVMSLLTYKSIEVLRLGDNYLLNDVNHRAIQDRANAAARDHSHATHFPMIFAETVGEIIKFFLFGATVSMLHPALVLLLIVGAIIDRRMSNWQWRKHYEERDGRNASERKRNYISSNITRNLSYQKEIRLYGMAMPLRKRFSKHIGECLGWQKKHEQRGFLVSLTGFITVLLRDGLAYALLIYKALSGEVDAAQFVLYFSAISSLAGLLGGMAWRFQQIKEGSAQISDIRELVEYEGRLNHGKGIALPKKPFSIEFKDVTFKYPKGEKNVLEHVSFEIKAGEKIALVGLNGAGKTTLVRLMCGLLLPDEGEVLIGGHTLYEYNRDEMYSLFGLIPQKYNLLPVSLEKNIACTVNEEEIDRQRLERAVELSGFKEKAESLPMGLKTPLNRTVNDDATDLSGGEKQRLLLARLIYRNPLCMILDEPTAALDPVAEDRMYRRYNEISKNATSVFISHRLASTRFCDRIFLLDGANFAEVGTHDELMAKHGKYRELFDVQAKYYQKEVPQNG